MDNSNKSILKYLQENARISNTEIGKRIGMSSPAVSERIKRMEYAEIIDGYSAQITPLKVGYQMQAIITLRVFMGMLKPFLEKVKTYKEVINCYRITGDENIVMEVVIKDQAHLRDFIDQLIIFGETKTQIVLSHIVKHNIINPL